MKNIKYIALVMLIFFITGCTNYEEIKTKEENKAAEYVSNINNVTTDLIKESYNYLKDNIDNINKKEIYAKLSYYNKYLEIISSIDKETDLYILSSNMNTYLEKRTKENKLIVKKQINKIDDNLDEKVNDIYNKYYRNTMVDKKIEYLNDKVIAEQEIKIDDREIRKGIEYINNHLDMIYQNEEIIEKIIYYSLYMSYNDDELISKTGNDVINYLKNPDGNLKREIKNNLEKI
ncbi:MAG: hypothetical protein ACI4WW_08030 [Candidatus Coprovivens sp.]